MRGGVLNSADLGRGFEFDGQRIPADQPKARDIQHTADAHLLSITTV